MLCYVMLCYVMLCYVMLCYVMLCYVMLCHVMSCYVVMLCYVMLRTFISFLLPVSGIGYLLFFAVFIVFFLHLVLRAGCVN